MVPFIVLVVSLLVFRGLGALEVGLFDTWQEAASYALAVMLLLTASAHFTKTREDLVKMVPNAFPNPELLVAVTGPWSFWVPLGSRSRPLEAWPACASPCSWRRCFRRTSARRGAG